MYKCSDHECSIKKKNNKIKQRVQETCRKNETVNFLNMNRIVFCLREYKKDIWFFQYTARRLIKYVLF